MHEALALLSETSSLFQFSVFSSSPLKPPALDTGLCWPPLKGVFHYLCCDDNHGSRTSHFTIKLSRELEWKLPRTETLLLRVGCSMLIFRFSWFPSILNVCQKRLKWYVFLTRTRVKEIKQANKRMVRSDPGFLGIAGKFISLVCGKHGNIIKRSPGNIARLQILYFSSRKRNIFLFQSAISPPSICFKYPQ